MLPLNTNARAKMRGIDGFVKIFVWFTTGIVIGKVVVANWIASELIEGLSLAVRAKLTVDQSGRAHGVPVVAGFDRRGRAQAAQPFGRTARRLLACSVRAAWVGQARLVTMSATSVLPRQ